MQINMLDAKSQLSKLVKAALAGEDIVIANKGVPAVRLVPITAAQPSRQPGTWSHLKMSDAAIAEAFSQATDEAVAAMFDTSLSGKTQSTKPMPARRRPRKP